MTEPQQDPNAPQPGPEENADALTESDAGLTGGTGASIGESTFDPTGSREGDDEDEDEG